MTLVKKDKLQGVDTALEFEDTAGRDAQGVALVDQDGDHSGVETNPLPVIPMPIDFGSAGNLTKTVGSTFVFDNTCGCSTIGFFLTDLGDGTVKSEITYDGTNWEPASMRCQGDDTIVSTITACRNYIGSIAGCRQWRLRVLTELDTDASIVGRADNEVSVIETIEFNAPPHRFGYPPTHKVYKYTTAQTNEVMWQPASGKRFVVAGLSLVAAGANDGVVTIFEDTNGNGNLFFDGTVQVANKQSFVWNWPSQIAIPADAIDTALKITTSAAITVSVMIYGYEV
jgi:hypothetical protein